MMDKFEALTNVLAQPNSHSVGVINIINNYYPAFAEKILDNNPVMEAMAMCGFCTMDILIYPICGHCETLAAYSNYAKKPDGSLAKKKDGTPIGVCTCWKCGKDTTNPITLKEWCLMELKKRAPKDIEKELVFAIDVLAEKVLVEAKTNYYRILKKENNNVQS